MQDKNRMISNEQKLLYAKKEKIIFKRHFVAYEKHIKEFIGKDKLEIIDIGGASGNFANEIHSYFNKHNTEASVKVIDYCEYDEWALFKNISFIQESAFKALTELQDNSVDLIFINLILHHIVLDTYKETRKAQIELLKLAYKKIKKNGLVLVNECYFQCPLLFEASTPVTFFMSSSKLSVVLNLSKILGSISAGVGVCFLPKKAWKETFARIGFILLDESEGEWKWVKKLLIREKLLYFILTKK